MTYAELTEAQRIELETNEKRVQAGGSTKTAEGMQARLKAFMDGDPRYSARYLQHGLLHKGRGLRLVTNEF